MDAGVVGRDQVQHILDEVWRHNLSGLGYYVLDVGQVDSRTLREKMVEIKYEFSQFNEFGFKSLSRFDQQETTRFHQDAGPDFNILMLGYEPTNIKSRIFIADHSCAANDIRVSPSELLIEAMLGNDERILPYVTELPQPLPGHSFILIINNSNSPVGLGVLHKAIIDTPNDNEKRIINSIMLNLGKDEVGVGRRHEFLTTDEISQKYEKNI